MISQRMHFDNGINDNNDDESQNFDKNENEKKLMKKTY